MTGLVGYTSQGIYKSLRTTFRSKTRESLASAGRVRDKYFLHAKGAIIDPVDILNRFTVLTERTAKSEGNAETVSITPPTPSTKTTTPNEEGREPLLTSATYSGQPAALGMPPRDPPPWSEFMAPEPGKSFPDAAAFLDVSAEVSPFGSEEPAIGPVTTTSPTCDPSTQLGSTAASNTRNEERDQNSTTATIHASSLDRRRSDPELPAYI